MVYLILFYFLLFKLVISGQDITLATSLVVAPYLVELQRCMKSSMCSGNGWRNGGKLEGTCKQWKVKEVIGFPTLC